MKTMQRILLWIMMLMASQGMTQSVTFTPSMLTTPNVTTSTRVYELNTTNTPSIPDIKINLSGFSCSTLTYDWETVSFIPIVPLSSPRFRVPYDNPINFINPEPYDDDAETRAQYIISGPGVYVIRLCVSSCNGTEVACSEAKIIARPINNVVPRISFENLSEIILPINSIEQLDAKVEDCTDQHTFTWSQSASNPMQLNLPNGGNPIDIPRGSNTTLSQLNLSGINKPGTYCFSIKANDERGGESEAMECFFIKPAASNFIIYIYPPNPSTLISPMDVLINAKITGINEYNDKIRYTWSQVSGPQTVALPSPAYISTSNSSFDIPTLVLGNLGYGTYTLRLRVEDGYYPDTFADQNITFIVRPPESNLSVSISPEETSIFKVPNEGFLFADSQSPDATKPFVVAGKVSGINTYSGAITTYWRLEPEQVDETDPDNLIFPVFTNFGFENIPVGATTSSDTLAFRYNEIKIGTYLFKYFAKDNFYGTEVSASMRIHIEKLVLRGAMIEANPNPVNNEINLVFVNDAKQRIEVQIQDLMGKNILTQEFPLGKGERKLVLDTHQIPNGFYILKVKSNLRDNITQKIVIRHD